MTCIGSTIGKSGFAATALATNQQINAVIDEPRNTVLYIDKPLKGHNLIQAVARVNRLHDAKRYGVLVDYRGILKELDTAMFDHPLKQYALFKSFEEKLETRSTPDLPDALADKPNAKAYFGAMRLVLGEEAFAELSGDSKDRLVQQAIAMDTVVRDAVAENSLNPQNIEAAIRKGLLPLLFGTLGLDNAKLVVEQVIQITRIGLFRS